MLKITNGKCLVIQLVHEPGRAGPPERAGPNKGAQLKSYTIVSFIQRIGPTVL